MTDPIIQRIETFPCHRGALLAERRNRGYNLYHAAAGRTVSCRLGRTTMSKFSIGRFGKSDGPAPGRSDAQLDRSIDRSRPRVHRRRGHLLDRQIVPHRTEIADSRAQGRSSWASAQIRRTTSPAGSARARCADCPAQACIRPTSWAAAAWTRILAVRPRCTG